MSSQDPRQREVVPTETEPWRQNTSLKLRDGGENTPLISNLYEEETDTPLLGSGCCMKVKSKFRSRHFCLCSSKAALIILVWNLIIAFGLVSLMDPTIYTSVYDYMYNTGTISLIIRSTLYGLNAFVFLFYPLAGYLADIRWGRHKTVVNSLCFIMWTLILMIVLGGLIIIGHIPVIDAWPSSLDALQITASVVLFVVFGIPAVFGVILLFCSLVAFNANVIQYGMDQLHDAPADDSILYIYWYVWTIYAGFLIIRLPIVYNNFMTVLVVLGPVLAPFLLGITLCIQKYTNRRWFLIDSGSRNPYKLVYQVFKFAKDHSNPIRRSAFTYCEDELPSRLDLGKEKYGGPFKNEDVENVKAFVGIECVLLSTGPTFIADIAVHAILPSIAEFDDYYPGNGTYNYNYKFINFYSSGCLTPLIIVVLIPLYLFLLRPFIQDYIPGMLKRMGIGMVMFFLSGLCTLLMGTFSYDCTTEYYDDFGSCSMINSLFSINAHFLIIQSSLNAVGFMLLNIATFEFICAQSPHSMKGFLIGTFFAIKGIFQLIGVLAVLTPVTALCKSRDKFPICGFIYFFLNIVILFIGIITFTIVARRYQYRVRDEPDNIYRYAEEYYANARDEPNYDYDDYDNLNVETIRN